MFPIVCLNELDLILVVDRAVDLVLAERRERDNRGLPVALHPWDRRGIAGHRSLQEPVGRHDASCNDGAHAARPESNACASGGPAHALKKASVQQLVNVPVGAAVYHVPRTVGRHDVRARIARGERRPGEAREIVVGDATRGPRQFANVAGRIAVDDVMRPVARDEEGARCRRTRRPQSRRVRGAREIVVTDGASGPVELVEVPVRAAVDGVLPVVVGRDVRPRVGPRKRGVRQRGEIVVADRARRQ